MKNLKFIFPLLIALLASGCNTQPQYTPADLAMMQPCTQMGYPAAQCFAAFQHAGRPNGNQWIDNVAAFAIGAAANHWWNRSSQPTYSYNDRYWDSHPRSNNTTIINNYGSSTPIDKGIANVQAPVVEQKNVKPIIQGQQVQPLFQPSKIVANQTAPKQSAPPVQQFKPIAVQPPKAAVISKPAFKPIQVTRPSSSSKKR
jgi:hypothetical protein